MVIIRTGPRLGDHPPSARAVISAARRLRKEMFVVGSWLGALGGALGIPVRAISPGMGTFFIIYAFVVAVIGGLGSMRGAFVGAMLLGLLTSYGVLFIQMFEMALVFILMAVVLIVHPKGIFGGR